MANQNGRGKPTAPDPRIRVTETAAKKFPLQRLLGAKRRAQAKNTMYLGSASKQSVQASPFPFATRVPRSLQDPGPIISTDVSPQPNHSARSPARMQAAGDGTRFTPADWSPKRPGPGQSCPTADHLECPSVHIRSRFFFKLPPIQRTELRHIPLSLAVPCKSSLCDIM